MSDNSLVELALLHKFFCDFYCIGFVINDWLYLYSESFLSIGCVGVLPSSVCYLLRFSEFMAAVQSLLKITVVAF